MIPDCCTQENKPHKPRKINIWPSKACLEATTGQDFDLDQMQRTEGLAGFCSLPKLFVSVLSPHSGLRALPAPEEEWHQRRHLLSRSKNCQVSALHRKVTYSKRQTLYQRSSLVMQMLLVKICLLPTASSQAVTRGGGETGTWTPPPSAPCWTQRSHGEARVLVSLAGATSSSLLH